MDLWTWALMQQFTLPSKTAATTTCKFNREQIREFRVVIDGTKQSVQLEFPNIVSLFDSSPVTCNCRKQRSSVRKKASMHTILCYNLTSPNVYLYHLETKRNLKEPPTSPNWNNPMNTHTIHARTNSYLSRSAYLQCDQCFVDKVIIFLIDDN